MQINPLGPALGAEVRGLDLEQPIPAAAAAALQEAFLEHHLLCFRTAPLPPVAFRALARCFGEPQLQLLRAERHPQAPEVSILESTYRRPEDKPDDLTRVRLSGWHTDDSYFAKPAKATLLQSLDLPSSGGQTKFSNLCRAWDTLSAQMQARIRPLRAVHGYDTMRASARAKSRSPEEAAETPDVVHPLVRSHEDSGRKAIYLNPNRTDHIVGLPREESDALLDTLTAHITREELQYHHEWRLGDILLWDNRCLVHAVNTDFPVGERRRHQRILLVGPAPV